MPESISPEEKMLLEVQSAMDKGDKARAKDLLTRLIRSNASDSRYWLWMSAAVESVKERIYCLNEALRLDPGNKQARMGLVALGAAAPDPALVIPLSAQRRDWESQMFSGAQAEKEIVARARRQAVVLGVSIAGLVLLVVAVSVVLGWSRIREVVGGVPEAPQPTFGFFTTPDTPTALPTGRFSTPLSSSVPPLSARLTATYTPTPLYVNTPHAVVEDYRSGIQRYQKNEWAFAATFLQNAARAEPNAPDIPYLLGEVYRFQKKSREALTAYEQSIKINPNFAPPYLGRARLNMAVDLNLAAIQPDLEKAVSLDPNLGEAYLELAHLKLDRKSQDPKGALKDLDQAARTQSGSPLLYLYRAQAELENKQPFTALQDARQAIQLDLTLLPAYRVLGEALRANTMIKDSADPLATYTLYVTDDKEAWTWLGFAYRENGDSQKAVDAFGEALTLDAFLFDARLARAQLYLQLKDGKKAAEDFRIAAAGRPDSFAAIIGRAQASLLLEEYLNANDYANAAFRVAQSDLEKASVYYYRAQALESLKQVTLAVNSWELLLKLPSITIPSDWLTTARACLLVLYTPTPTQTGTRTLTPTITPTPTRTGTPTRTFIPTNTTTFQP